MSLNRTRFGCPGLPESALAYFWGLVKSASAGALNLVICPEVFFGQNEMGEIAMAGTDVHEASKGGSRSVMAVAIVSAILFVAMIIIGYRSPQHVAPNKPQSNTESPATTDSKSP